MANDKKMELMLEIKARANQALAELSKLDKALGVLANMGKSFGGLGSMQALGKGLSVFLAPLKALVPVAGGAAAAAVLLGGKAIKTAAEFEALKLQLEAVTGSAAEAKKVFDETKKFANVTPWKLDELVQVKALLLGVGISGQGSLESVSDAAAGMNRSIMDVAKTLTGMEAEPLRGLGIQLSQNAGEFTFSFRDKMQKLHTVAVKGREAAQAELMKIFRTKFGGATEKLGGSGKGLASTLADAITNAFGDVGEGMLPAAKSFAQGVIDNLTKLSESGGLKKMGEKIGEWMMKAVDNIMAFFDTLPAAFEAIQKLMTGDGGLWAVLKEAFLGGIDILATGFIEIFRASGNIWLGLGKFLFHGFAQELSHIPGFGFLANPERLAKMAAGNMSDSQADEYYRKYDLPGKGTAAGLMENIEAGNLTDNQLKDLGSRGPGLAMESGVTQALMAVPTMMANMSGKFDERMARFGEVVKKETGLDFGPEFESNVKRRESKRANAGFTQVVTTAEPIYGTNAAGDRYHAGVKYSRGPGSGEVGQRYGAEGVVVNVKYLSVKADTPRRVANKVVWGAGMPKVSNQGQ